MTAPDVKEVHPTIAKLLQADHLPDLGPGIPDVSQGQQLRSLSLSDLFAGARIVDREMARACQAGLFLLVDSLDESHAISQEIHTPTGSFWHGIMHRREPDYANAKYWFRRVGEHPIYPELLSSSRSAIERANTASVSQLQRLFRQSQWDPFGFVDLCEEAAGSSDTDFVIVCRRIAAIEWRLLFDFSYQSALRGRASS